MWLSRYKEPKAGGPFEALGFEGKKAAETRPYGGVAQLGEHLLCKQGVSGSNPLISTTRAHSSAG